ncbi:MAG TPA: phosphoribosylformylglycinamidine synthase subunit PurS [Opitutales bacterium]|jgi:phosphoribosylformylglycinamidine synthase PurS subunit|nr:phosphoribosylformylglycinamidine synthase subunit PurS [Opitutales bacterium]
MKVTVFVTPKKNLLDPQGDAVGHAMATLGLPGEHVRVGKTIEFTAPGADSPEFRAALDKLSRDLLSNPVIEDFRYEIQA